MDDRRKPLVVMVAVILLALVGVYFVMPKQKEERPRYGREASRVTIDIQKTDFYQDLERGKSSINSVMGGFWVPTTMPVPDRYKDKLLEKVIFTVSPETIANFSQAIVLDIYSKETFSSVSSYLKIHAKELHDKTPTGKVKILHDGPKGIVYQWRIPDANGETTYIELGKVSMTEDGVFSVKYINKGTADLEMQRQRAFRLFGKF